MNFPLKTPAVTLPNTVNYEHGISAIDAEYYRPGLASIHLIRSGNQAALVDTGTNSSVPGVMQILQAKQIAPESVTYVFLTHIHLDHAGGAGAFMQHFPNAKLVVHPRGARHMADPARLITSATSVYGETKFRQLYGTILPVEASRIIEAPDGLHIDFNGRPLLFLDTPGHARHHYCIFDEQSHSFFTGDTFGLSYRELDVNGLEFVFPTTTPVQFDPIAAHASLDRIMHYQPQHAFLTHYSRIGNLPHHAARMHTLIDTHAAIARKAASLTEGRTEAITAELATLLLEQVIAHGCTLPPTTICDLLAKDVSLNAQGLEYWLDHPA